MEKARLLEWICRHIQVVPHARMYLRVDAYCHPHKAPQRLAAHESGLGFQWPYSIETSDTLVESLGFSLGADWPHRGIHRSDLHHKSVGSHHEHAAFHLATVSRCEFPHLTESENSPCNCYEEMTHQGLQCYYKTLQDPLIEELLGTIWVFIWKVESINP